MKKIATAFIVTGFGLVAAIATSNHHKGSSTDLILPEVEGRAAGMNAAKSVRLAAPCCGDPIPVCPPVCSKKRV